MPSDDAELEPVRGLGPATSWTSAHALLLDHGWRPVGAGDWAWVLRSPSGRRAGRVSPFDPAAPYTAALYDAAAGTRLVPSDVLFGALGGGASLLVMELLEPVAEPVAAAFHRRLADWDPDLAELAAHVRAVHARGAAEQPFWGPVDTNPDNVMRRADGTLVLTDPYYADGPALFRTAASEPDRFVALVPAARRRHLTEIPLAGSGPWEPGAQEALRRTVLDADARAAGARATLAPGT